MITPEIIGKNLVNARADKGYTQKELADKLAVSPQNISKWERGVSVPDVITLLQIAEILNKDIKDFLDSHYQKEVVVASPEPTAPTVVKYVDSVFSNANWYKQRISEIKRNGIYLFNSVMRYAEFSSLSLEHCKIKDCELFHCSSDDAKISDTEIKHSFFRFMKITGAALSSCKINASFYKCDIKDSSFSAIVFEGCNMDVIFDNCKFSRIAVKNFRKARHCTFENCEMDKMSEQIFREIGATIINCKIMED
ncbi:MAG: helix-turn-helix domain-containing protein [Clostridia bacterium]|nr:helix-turn-helix domain-containing protein [Clostridia bacterium]